MIVHTTAEDNASATDGRINHLQPAVRAHKERKPEVDHGASPAPLSKSNSRGTLQQRLEAIQTSAAEACQYTYHVEPSHVGGARYVKCTQCEAEGVPADPERLSHHEGCSEGSQ
jgi:hypothetical protein